MGGCQSSTAARATPAGQQQSPVLLNAAGEQIALIKGATCIREIRQRAAAAMSATVDEIKLSSKEGNLLDDSAKLRDLGEFVTAIRVPAEKVVLSSAGGYQDIVTGVDWTFPVGLVVGKPVQFYSYDMDMGRVLRADRASGIVVKVQEESVLVNLTKGDKRGRVRLSYSSYSYRVSEGSLPVQHMHKKETQQAGEKIALLSAEGEKTALIKATCTSEIRQRAAEAMSTTVDEIKLSSKEGKLLNDSEDASDFGELVAAIRDPARKLVLSKSGGYQEQVTGEDWTFPEGLIVGKPVCFYSYWTEEGRERSRDRASGIVLEVEENSALVDLTKGDKHGRCQVSYSSYRVSEGSLPVRHMLKKEAKQAGQKISL